MIQTGVYLTDSEFQEIERAFQHAQNMPAIIFVTHGSTLGEMARQGIYQRIQQLAAAHGLPALPSGEQYGIRRVSGEFVRDWDFANGHDWQ